MHKFLTHESIAAGCFNVGECCASATQSAWQEILTLSETNIHLLVRRLSSDYSRAAAKMRKVWTSKDIDTMMHFLRSMFHFFSSSSYSAMKLRSQFKELLVRLWLAKLSSPASSQGSL